jgi:hypothetical protein
MNQKSNFITTFGETDTDYEIDSNTYKNFLSKSSLEISENKIHIVRSRRNTSNKINSNDDNLKNEKFKKFSDYSSYTMKRFFKSTTELEDKCDIDESEVSDNTNRNKNLFQSIRNINSLKNFKTQLNDVTDMGETDTDTNIEQPVKSRNEDTNKRKKLKNLFTIAIRKHFSHHSNKKSRSINAGSNSKKNSQTEEENENFFIKNLQKIEDVVYLTSQIALKSKIQADCRSYEEKKNEINDMDLNNYLENSASKIRRNAICEKIDKLENNKQLLNFMEYLLREDYIKNFLL